MSEERVIRINKVLREFNISLERAVDYLKDKGIVIDANPNAKISDNEYSILQNQFAGDKGNKEASKEVGEEKRKEKEALRVEREKEIEDKRKQDEERQRQEVIKAKAVVSGPKQVGTIDLNAPEVKAPAAKTVETETPKAETKKESPKAKACWTLRDLSCATGRSRPCAVLILPSIAVRSLQCWAPMAPARVQRSPPSRGW